MDRITHTQKIRHSPVPIELSQLSADDYDYYTSKYGAENMKKGQFFHLPSGKTSSIAHELNLKYKVGN